uniref:Uncharacterized protein n=1 Tax=Romanomermis culicivorax TaxID=13658 RepID=A0A915LAX4_ROMCU
MQFIRSPSLIIETPKPRGRYLMNAQRSAQLEPLHVAFAGADEIAVLVHGRFAYFAYNFALLLLAKRRNGRRLTAAGQI